MEFTANGRRIVVTREGVIDALRNVRPEPATKWMVEVEGIDYPVKQALSAATGLSRSDFISTVAQTKLAALGFGVHQHGMSPQLTVLHEEVETLTDVQKLVDAVWGLEIGDLGTEYGYQNAVLCLIDAIFSLGIRYTTTRRVIEHFTQWWNAHVPSPDATSSSLTLSDFAAALPYEPDVSETEARETAKEVFGNLNRTSSRSGVLKSLAVLEAAEVSLSFGIDTREDLLQLYGDGDFERAYRSVPGQASGVSLRYLYMLAGHVDEAKPDRMILRFLERHLGYTPDNASAVRLLRDAVEQLRCDGLDVDVRRLDHAIWRHESNQVEQQSEAMLTRDRRSKYSPLHDYLSERTEGQVELTFGQLEAILGFRLPESARNHSAYWANHYGGTHVWAMEWMDAGWRVDSHSLIDERVVFVREGHGQCA